jgi:hypothetical protein
VTTVGNLTAVAGSLRERFHLVLQINWKSLSYARLGNPGLGLTNPKWGRPQKVGGGTALVATVRRLWLRRSTHSPRFNNLSFCE